MNFTIYSLPFRSILNEMSSTFPRRLLALLMATFLTACSISDGGRTLVLIPNPISAALYQVEKQRIRGSNEPWTLFLDERAAKESIASEKFWGMCRDLSYNKSAILPISGFRILDMKASALLPARGYLSPIDFYAACEERRASAHSVVEAIEREIEMEKLPMFLEFKGNDGVWRKSSLDNSNGKLVTVETNEAVASHGLLFEQISTGYEKEYTLYGVSISVIDLATKQVVAENIGFRRDVYWGAHNHYRLIPYGIRCGYPEEDNYVGAWLSSLIRKPAPETINPYDGFTRRKVVIDEDRHWSDKCSSPTVREQWPNSEGNLIGKIVSRDQDVLNIRRFNTREIVSIRISSDSRVYAYSGRSISLSDLLVGEEVKVWFTDCGRSGGLPPEAAHIGIYTTLASSRVKDPAKESESKKP